MAEKPPAELPAVEKRAPATPAPEKPVEKPAAARPAAPPARKQDVEGLRKGLTKVREKEGFFGRLKALLTGKKEIDPNIVEQIDQMADRRKADIATRAFIGHAEETEIDKQGRVLLPQLLRKLAHLDTRAVAVGQIKRIEIWSEDIWTEKASAAQGDELADAFASLRR